jgi:hypothetical protein
MLVPLMVLALQSPAPVLDGTITPGEWDHATHVTGSTGLEVHTSVTDTATYVAVRGTGAGFPHIALMHGDTVLILHASAALGTARYAGAGDSMRLVQPFAYSVRRTGMDVEAQAERDAFYLREGWVATTARMGAPGETEFKIARSRGGPGQPIAVAYWSERSGVQHWPAALADAVVVERVVQGHLPEEAVFFVAEWGSIE